MIPNNYNVLYILNQKYAELALMSIRSLLNSADGSRLKRILVADIGLRRDTLRLLRQLSPQIEIVPTGVWVGNSQRRHSRYWTEAVSLKTRILRALVSNPRYLPLVLLDTDTVVTADFSHHLNATHDIQVCRRHVPAQRFDMTMDYIASFLAVHSSQSVDFIDAWIERIALRIQQETVPPFETPALCQMITEWEGRLKIGEVDELAVSSPNRWVEDRTCIIHMKSEELPDSTNLALGRIHAVRDYPRRHLLDLYEALPVKDPSLAERASRRLLRLLRTMAGRNVVR